MSRVITFSRYFPSYHPRKGEPTYFVEKIWKSIGNSWFMHNVDKIDLSIEVFNHCKPKHHTIRAGQRWKVGEKFSPCVWSLPGGRFTKGNKQIIIAPNIEIKKVWNFCINESSYMVDNRLFGLRGIREIAENDGFADSDDFKLWFSPYKNFKGQIISWNDKIDY